MAKPKVLFSFLMIVLSGTEIECQVSRCVVVAPRSIRSNSDYALSIATHGATEPTQFRVKIYERNEPKTNRTLDYRPNKKSTRNDSVDSATKRGPKPKLMKQINEDKISMDVNVPVTLSKTRTITVQPNTPEIIKFKYDTDIMLGSFVLEIVSLSSSAGSAFYEKQFLSVESEIFSIFIHTNKASYRPGELFNYRIIVVDADTRPVAITSSLTVNIYDASRNLVSMKTQQSAMKGVFSGEYKIPGGSRNGVWQIEAVYKDKQIRKQFEITSAERSNFQVIARTPNFVSNSSTQFSVGVECFYSFGKPIAGTAVVKATPILQSSSSRTETGQSLTVTKDVRGTYLLTFQMSDFKIPKMRTWDSILIETTVQEKATGRVARGHDKTIPVDYKRIPSKYEILLYYFGFFLPGQMYSIKVHVRAKSGVAIPAGMRSIDFTAAFDSDLAEAATYTSYALDGNGKTDIMVQMPSNVVSKLNFKVRHGDSFEDGTVMVKKLHVQVINSDTPKLGQKIQFMVGCQDLLSKLHYYVVGRGNVLVSQVVDIAGKNTGIFEFDGMLAMTPSSSLVVYYVTEAGEIISDETVFAFEPEVLANPLTVTVSETRLKPNQELTVTMTTGENSLVSLTGVDQNVLLENQGNELSRNKVYNGLRLYDNAGDMDLDASYTDSYSKLLTPGTLVLTDAMIFKPGTLPSLNLTAIRRDTNYDYTVDTQSSIVIPLQPTCSYDNLTAQEQLDLQNTASVRSKFIDTLLWQDVEYTSGVTTLKTIVPETVTSWSLTGYSLSANGGLGLLQTPLVLTTFKPFFTDIRVPGPCKMGEVALIQVIVHNYMDQLSRVEVTLDDSAGDFDIIPSGRAFTDYVEYDENFEQRNLKLATFQVVSDGVRATTFSVRPKKIGAMKLRVQTISSVACDTVEKIIMVEPPGKTIRRSVTRQVFLTPSQPVSDSKFVIDIPPNAVPGSMKVQVSVQGDKYSLELENQRPVAVGDDDPLVYIFNTGLNLLGPQVIPGCGGQNAVAELRNIINNFFKGQCPDGGYRIDADCTQPLRDTIFTARTMNLAARASTYNHNDPIFAIKALDWLTTIQRADGSFPNPNPSTFYAEGVTTTSFVLYSFLDVNYYLPGAKAKYVAAISKAMDYLFAQVESLDLLSLTYLCRAAQLMPDTRKEVALSKLHRLSFKNEHTQHWPRSALMDEALWVIYDIYRDEPDILTAYRVANGLTQYLVKYYDQLRPELKLNLLASVNFFGAFAQTSNYRMNLTFVTLESGAASTVLIDTSNRFLQSTLELDSQAKTVNVMASGAGLATVEMTYEYNLMPADIVDAYLLQLTLTSAMSKEWQLSVCASSKVTPNPLASVMEIKFPPGFNTTEFVQNYDAMTPQIKNKELKGDGMTVDFEGLDSQLSCFVVPLYRVAFVEQPLVGSVTIQDKDLKNEKPHISSADYILSSFDSMEIVEI